MKRLISVLTLTIILGTGCGGQTALDQAGTMVAQTVAAAPPTETLQPPSTLPPANTPTPKPTATANIPLTATVEGIEVLSELDVHVGSNSGIPYRDGHLAWRQIEPITINMTGPQKDAGLAEEIDENLTAANFIFKSDVTWNASGILICGVIFRSEINLQKGEQYQFYFYRLSGLPAYLIDVYEFGRYKYTISNTKFSDSLNVENDGTNQFLLIAQDEAFDVYVNGKHQGRFVDESQQRRSEGIFGFLGWQESGNGTCTFENSWIWALE
jgi:hypothetical protein